MKKFCELCNYDASFACDKSPCSQKIKDEKAALKAVKKECSKDYVKDYITKKYKEVKYEFIKLENIRCKSEYHRKTYGEYYCKITDLMFEFFKEEKEVIS